MTLKKRGNSAFQIALEAVWNEVAKRPKYSTLTRKEIVELILVKCSLKRDSSILYSYSDKILRILQDDKNIERFETGKYLIINNKDNGKSFR